VAIADAAIAFDDVSAGVAAPVWVDVAEGAMAEGAMAEGAMAEGASAPAPTELACTGWGATPAQPARAVVATADRTAAKRLVVRSGRMESCMIDDLRHP
jgi:hypothetical protein